MCIEFGRPMTPGAATPREPALLPGRPPQLPGLPARGRFRNLTSMQKFGPGDFGAAESVAGAMAGCLALRSLRYSATKRACLAVNPAMSLSSVP